MKKRITAFTLAEVLITMAIIGVISALTVPNLVGNASKKGQVALIRKAYVELQDSIDSYMAEIDAKTTASALSTQAKVNSFLTEFFKVTKNCGATVSSCMNTKIYLPNSTSYIEISLTDPSCITNASGISVCMEPYNSTNGNGKIVIDTNGLKDPNIKGRDVFELTYSSNGEISDSASSDCASTSKISGCFTKLQEDNYEMNY